MSPNAAVIQKLESLLSRVTRRAAEPRPSLVAEAAARQLALDEEAREAAQDTALTTAPPPLPPVSVVSLSPEVPAAAAPLEDDSVGVDEPTLIPVEESASDGELLVVEATVAPVFQDAETQDAPVPLTDIALTAPPPPLQAAAAPPAARISEAPATPQPHELAAAAAPVTVPEARTPSEPAVAEDPAVAAPAEAARATPAASPQAEAVPQEEAPTGAGASAAIIAAAAVIAVVESVIEAAEARAEAATHPDAEVTATGLAAEAPARSLDGSRTDPPPDFPREAPPLELVAEVPQERPTAEVTLPADEETKPPSSSRRIRGGTMPPPPSVTRESGAHAIPEREGAAGELSLSVQGAVVARTAVSGDVAAFVSAAAAEVPQTFAAWLEESLTLG